MECAPRSPPRVLLGVSGSVAAVKLPLLVEGLLARGAEVRVVSTRAAEHFWRDVPSQVTVYRDADEWSTWTKMGDPVLHIELRKWATVFVIAPLDANSLSKIATGACDNLLTCVARCWNVTAGTMLVAPAMNTLMWDHPVTAKQIRKLQKWNIGVISPISKTLACGDTGVGAMAAWETIVEATWSVIQRQSK